MQKISLYVQPEQLRKLRVIGDISVGKPDVSALIRDAIDDFIELHSSRNSTIARAINAVSAPRLVRAVLPSEIKSGGNEARIALGTTEASDQSVGGSNARTESE